MTQDKTREAERTAEKAIATAKLLVEAKPKTWSSVITLVSVEELMTMATVLSLTDLIEVE